MFILADFNPLGKFTLFILFFSQYFFARFYWINFLFGRRILKKIIILIRNFFFKISEEVSIDFFVECFLSSLFKQFYAIHIFIIFKDIGNSLIYHETKNRQLNVINFFHLILCFFRLRFRGGLLSWKDKQVVILSWI